MKYTFEFSVVYLQFPILLLLLHDILDLNIVHFDSNIFLLLHRYILNSGCSLVTHCSIVTFNNAEMNFSHHWLYSSRIIFCLTMHGRTHEGNISIMFSGISCGNKHILNLIIIISLKQKTSCSFALDEIKKKIFSFLRHAWYKTINYPMVYCSDSQSGVQGPPDKHLELYYIYLDSVALLIVKRPRTAKRCELVVHHVYFFLM